jgi:hypothetical protein
MRLTHRVRPSLITLQKCSQRYHTDNKLVNKKNKRNCCFIIESLFILSHFSIHKYCGIGKLGRKVIRLTHQVRPSLITLQKRSLRYHIDNKLVNKKKKKLLFYYWIIIHPITFSIHKYYGIGRLGRKVIRLTHQVRPSLITLQKRSLRYHIDNKLVNKKKKKEIVVLLLNHYSYYHIFLFISIVALVYFLLDL